MSTAPVFNDLIFETSTTTGTGSLTLAGAATRRRAFSSAYANGNAVLYTVEHQTANEWEVNLGTWTTGDVLTRGTVIQSSNGGSAVSFSAGTKNVYAGLPADKANLPKVTTYTNTSSSTHTIASFAKMIHVFGVTPGGGGGGGRRGAAGTARGGGSGGGGGQYFSVLVPRSLLGSTLTVRVPDPTGSGGAGATVNSTNGTDATAVLSTYVKDDASGKYLVSAGAGGFGSGGVGGQQTTVGTGASGWGQSAGGNGGQGYSATAGTSSTGPAGGGGGGGGGVHNAGNYTGGAGGVSPLSIVASPLLTGLAFGGSGGAGGDGPGGNGTKGASYGGGGGGGAGNTNGANGGTGGDGGDGICVIVEY